MIVPLFAEPHDCILARRDQIRDLASCGIAKDPFFAPTVEMAAKTASSWRPTNKGSAMATRCGST